MTADRKYACPTCSAESSSIRNLRRHNVRQGCGGGGQIQVDGCENPVPVDEGASDQDEPESNVHLNFRCSNSRVFTTPQCPAWGQSWNLESAAHGPLQEHAKETKTTEASGRKNLSIVWQYFTKVEVKEKGMIVRKVRSIVCGALFADSSTNKSGGSTGKYRQHLMLHTVKNSAASRQSVLDVGQLLKGRLNKPVAAPTSFDVTAIVEANILKWMVATSKPFCRSRIRLFSRNF
ncbi:hypothetical protein V1524DRAFT_410547 [Lipomyces starkeyi]